MNGMLWIVASALVTVAGLLYLRRLRRVTRRPGLTDEMIARIESGGMVEVDDEPLDLDEAAAEEESFWNDEPWDEPEEL